jgi:hypothetical protein
VDIYSKHCQTPARRARELKFVENVHPHCVSCVTHTQKKIIKKIIKKNLQIKLDKVVELVGGGCVINKAYPA